MEPGSENLPVNPVVPWFQRETGDRVKYIAFGLKEGKVAIQPPYQNDLCVNYHSLQPEKIKDYEEHAQKIQPEFDKYLQEYLAGYQDSVEVDAVMDGSRCYIFPDSFDKQADAIKTEKKPINFVDIESLMFYLGVNPEEAYTFLDDFDGYRGNRLIDGMYPICGQLLARILKKDVRVSVSVKRDLDWLMTDAKPVTPHYSPDPYYKAPRFDNHERVNTQDGSFIVIEPTEKQ